LRGRTFQPGDTAADVIVGERFGALLFPGADPVGHSFRQARGKAWLRVVGVVNEISHPSLDANADRPEFYQPLMLDVPQTAAPARQGGGQIMLSVRCQNACPDVAKIRERLLTANPNVRVLELEPLDDAYRDDVARPKAAAVLAFVFAGIALIAAAGGLFAVLSHAVADRKREFGVRAAMGADPARLRRLVRRDGVIVAASGAFVGSIGALLLSKYLTSLQYGITAANALVWIAVAILIFGTTAAATWRPARHAAAADPSSLLRE
jgi:putative ABC transport system permease protein